MARLIAVINTAFDETLREQIRRTAEETGFAVQFYESEAEAGEALQEAEVIYGVAPKTAQTSDALRWLWAGREDQPLWAIGKALGFLLLLTLSVSYLAMGAHNHFIYFNF